MATMNKNIYRKLLKFKIVHMIDTKCDKYMYTNDINLITLDIKDTIRIMSRTCNKILFKLCKKYIDVLRLKE